MYSHQIFVFASVTSKKREKKFVFAIVTLKKKKNRFRKCNLSTHRGSPEVGMCTRFERCGDSNVRCFFFGFFAGVRLARIVRFLSF